MLYQYSEKKFYEIQDSGDTQDIDLIQQKLINAAFFNQTRTTLKSLFVDDPERNAMYFLTTVKSKDFVNVKPGVENKEARTFLRPVVLGKNVRKLLKYFAGLTGAAIFVANLLFFGFLLPQFPNFLNMIFVLFQIYCFVHVTSLNI